MMNYVQLVPSLNNNNIEHEIIQHEKTIQSAQEGADYFGIEIGQTAPTLVLKSEEGYYAIIISGDYGRIEFDSLKLILNCTELKLAKPKEVEQLTGCTVGTVPLIGHNLPTIIDRQLHRYDFVYGGTGIPNSTLKISPDAVEKLNQVIAFVR